MQWAQIGAGGPRHFNHCDKTSSAIHTAIILIFFYVVLQNKAVRFILTLVVMFKQDSILASLSLVTHLEFLQV